MRQQANSSRVPVISTNGHEMNREFNDNMENEYSIEAFRQKLDELTESLDHNINFEKIIQDAKNTTPVKQIMSLQSQPQSDGTTRNSQGIASSASPEPPTPVKTPLRRQNQYGVYHPDRSTMTTPSVPERRLGPRSSTVQSTTRNPPPLQSTTTASSRSPDRTTATAGATAAKSAATAPPHQDTTTTPESIQRQMNELYHTLEQQEERIRQLEYENDVCLPPSMRATPYGSSSSSRSHRRRYPDDPHSRRRRPVSTTTPSSSDIRGGGHQSSSRPGSTASPGQRFVEELVQIMDLPLDLHEPLSHIMDRQFYSENGP